MEIFDQLVEGVFCVDANWHFTYLNPSARRLLLVGDEVLGAPFGMYILKLSKRFLRSSSGEQ